MEHLQSLPLIVTVPIASFIGVCGFCHIIFREEFANGVFQPRWFKRTKSEMKVDYAFAKLFMTAAGMSMIALSLFLFYRIFGG
jgi:hypothetical protein